MPCHATPPKSSLDSLPRHPPLPVSSQCHGRVYVSLRQAANHLPYAGLLPKPHGPPHSLGGGHARKSSGLNVFCSSCGATRYHFLPLQPKPGFFCLHSESCSHRIWGALDFPGGKIFEIKVTFEPGCDFPIANIEVVCMITWTFISPSQAEARRFWNTIK
jgi:hypothetical protein